MAGFSAGLMAVILKSSVHAIQHVLSSLSFLGWGYILFPMVGIGLSVWVVQRFFGGRVDRGLPPVLLSIAQKSGFISRVNQYLHVLTSALTVGFGGSAGLEAPIVATGSAIGSNLARRVKTNYPERLLLLASGAAGGIAAAFNAPIAGVMFAMEVILPETVVSHFIPLLIASASGAICSRLILNESILFEFQLHEGFAAIQLPFYILLGGFSGLLSVHYMRMSHAIEGLFQRFPERPYLRAVVGSAALGVLILILPPLFGEGYPSVKILASGNPWSLLDHPIFPDLPQSDVYLLILVASVFLLKGVATSITIASGGNGGNFAPSLFVGAYLGFFFSRLINQIKWLHLPEENFTVVGMAGILSGVMHAPLTAIFLIAEITGGYTLIVPLMIVSSIALFISRHYERYSMDTKKLATQGKIFTTDRDHNVLQRLRLGRLLEADVITVPATGTLNDLVEAIKKSRRNLFPVVHSNGDFAGIVLLDDVKDVIFDRDLYRWVVIEDVMTAPPATLDLHEDMDHVMKTFEQTQAWNLPVLDGTQYVGMVSKAGIFNQYRDALADQQEVF